MLQVMGIGRSISEELERRGDGTSCARELR
jgi:hypothetical protein